MHCIAAAAAPALTAVPGLQLDFADAPLRFYGTSRAFGLVSDNGYVAFDYTTYPYDPNTFGTDDLGSPKVCTRKILAVVNVAGVQVQFTASPPRTLPDLFQLRADCPILQRCQPAGARCQLRHPGEPRVPAVGRDISGRRSSCCARPPGLLQQHRHSPGDLPAAEGSRCHLVRGCHMSDFLPDRSTLG